MSAEDDEIVQEFLVESHENLDQLDRDLVELEQHPGSRDLLSGIFRTIHTIKGASGFLAFGRLESLAHVGENLLSQLRDGERTMSAPLTEVLLLMVDCVRSLLDVIERTGVDADPSIDVDAVVEAIRRVLDGDVGPVDKTGAAQDDAPDHERAAAAVEADRAAAPDAAEVGSGETDEAEPPPATAPVVAVAADSVEVGPAAPATEAQQLDLTALPDHPSAEEAPRRGVADSTVRVDVELLDTLVRLVGELVLTRNQILQQADGRTDPELARASQRLNLVASELQESVMKTRMQPIGQVWAKLPRVVRDLAAQLGRQVRLEMDGQETELDRSLLEAVKDPLTHLVRNAIDHGIEPAAERLAKGKAVEGTLSLRAYHESGQVVVEISDDGKGLDPQHIGNVALRRGVVTQEQLARMSARETVELIFRAGFSTAEKISNVSGRGVGMDVVRTNIERIGGTVDLASFAGGGTTVRVRIPLTLAIIPALVVGEGHEKFAIPQPNLVELVRLDNSEIEHGVETLAGAPLLRLRGSLLPLVSLAGTLGLATTVPESQLTVVVVQADDLRFGLLVSEVFDTQEIVVKPLGRQLKSIAYYAGATIMGDGKVALILDVAGLAQSTGVAVASSRHQPTERSLEEVPTSLLVLDVGGGQRAALPLGSVSRLEEVPVADIERSGASSVVQYRDGILPLIHLADAIGVSRGTAEAPTLMSVIVHGDGNDRVGIVVDRVLDVVETTARPHQVGRRRGVLGSAVIQERVTDLVDIDALAALTGSKS